MKSYTRPELKIKMERMFEAIFSVQDQIKKKEEFPAIARIDQYYELVRFENYYIIRDRRHEKMPKPYKRRAYIERKDLSSYSIIGVLIARYFELLETDEL